MFYSTTHSTHFITVIKATKEGRKCFIERHTQHILFTVIKATKGRKCFI